MVATPARQTAQLPTAVQRGSAQSGGRFALLDGLRICAASLVMLYHFTAYESHGLAWDRPLVQVFPNLWHVTAYGALGVQLFFIISGFVILMSSWGRTLPQSVASRISRLYPAYWLGVGLTSLLLLVIWKDAVHHTASEALVNLTMVQSLFGVGNIDGVYWTLWVELCFYVLISLFTNVILSVHVTSRGMFHTIEQRTHHDLPNAACGAVIVAFFALIALVTLTPLRGVSWRWLTWAGILTYPLYLTHQYWGLWLIHLLHPHASTWLTLSTAIVAVFALAWAVHLVAERPFHQRLRRAIERSFVTTAAGLPASR